MQITTAQLAISFKIVSPTEWRFDQSIVEPRRTRLLTTEFPEIVKRLVDESQVLICKRKLSKKNPGDSRAYFKLSLGNETVDLFHNGAGGYRAQYYLDPALGEQANPHVLTAINEIAAKANHSLPPDFVSSSMSGPGAKVWIREGAWLSDNKDHHLDVARWKVTASKVGLHKRFQASWAELTPEKETILEIKGGWVDEQFRPTDSAKPLRTEELHLHGYT